MAILTKEESFACSNDTVAASSALLSALFTMPWIFPVWDWAFMNTTGINNIRVNNRVFGIEKLCRGYSSGVNLADIQISQNKRTLSKLAFDDRGLT